MLHLEMRRNGTRPTASSWCRTPCSCIRHERQRRRGRAGQASRLLLLVDASRPRGSKHVKYYADGAIYSQLMQMSQPYLDGHHGEWMMPPQTSRVRCWTRSGGAAGDIHVHVNGDAGLDLVLDQIERLRARHDEPRTRAPCRARALRLRPGRPARHVSRSSGIAVSNNAYYLHELAPIYAEHGLGPERAADISPLGGLARAGVPISFHSDYPMAPAEPLTLVWVAVNRVASDGRVWGADQKLSLDLALRAVTVEAAWSLGMEDEIGSIRPGKRADFTVLEEDPYAVDPMALKDIEIWGTVLDGRVHPVVRK